MAAPKLERQTYRYRESLLTRAETYMGTGAKLLLTNCWRLNGTSLRVKNCRGCFHTSVSFTFWGSTRFSQWVLEKNPLKLSLREGESSHNHFEIYQGILFITRFVFKRNDFTRTLPVRLYESLTGFGEGKYPVLGSFSLGCRGRRVPNFNPRLTFWWEEREIPNSSPLQPFSSTYSWGKSDRNLWISQHRATGLLNDWDLIIGL